MRRVKKNHKAILAILWLLLIFLFIWTTIAGGTEKNNYIQVTVQNGDTIWDLARKYAKPQQDIRDIVYQVKQENNLSSVYLLPGQKIRIPID